MSCRPYSLTHPPNAPKKKKSQHMSIKRPISRLVLPPTPPPPAPKKKMRRSIVDLTPIPLEWEKSEEENDARFLADSGRVRAKYLRCSPKDIEKESSIPFLQELWELYFPHSQPRNKIEETYLSLMRDCIKSRLNLLSAL